MTARLTGSIIAAVLVAFAASPAAAQQGGDSRPSVDLNLDLKIGRDGFRLGGQLFGVDGVWGAWLNGARRPGGFTLDGRVQDPQRTFNFKMNADIEDWMSRLLPGTAPVVPRDPNQF